MQRDEPLSSRVSALGSGNGAIPEGSFVWGDVKVGSEGREDLAGERQWH